VVGVALDAVVVGHAVVVGVGFEELVQVVRVGDERFVQLQDVLGTLEDVAFSADAARDAPGGAEDIEVERIAAGHGGVFVADLDEEHLGDVGDDFGDDIVDALATGVEGGVGGLMDDHGRVVGIAAAFSAGSWAT
jgi:hypothetical protein